MPVLKPIRGIRLNKSHPLARGLVGYWLLNEGSGNKAFDLSGNGNTGTEQQDSVWQPGKFGPARYFSGDDYITVADNTSQDLTGPHTIIIYAKPSTLAVDEYAFFISKRGGSGGNYQAYARNSLKAGRRTMYYWNGTTVITGSAATAFVDNQWQQFAFVHDGTNINFYLDAILKDTQAEALGSAKREALYINNDSGSGYGKSTIDHILIYNRALIASEIALLYREPFCLVDRAWRPLKLGGQIVEFVGTSAASSSVEGSLSKTGTIVELAGTIAARSNVNGYLDMLDWTQGSWITEALFNGMTANAFKLGTTLSLGWFWVRVAGCSTLYRGTSILGVGDIGGVDFANILTVSDGSRIENPESRIEYISPPSYIPHNNGSTHFYVVRRFNNCGYQERTLAAAVKVSIGSSGELAEPQPNNISSSKAEQVDSNKVRLTWYYCPLEQGSKPVGFNVYYDDRTGQIDYFDPLAIIEYKGRRFYSFQSSALEAGDGGGGYLFAIRAEDAGGIENISLARLKIQLDTLNPDAIDILSAEAV